MARILAALALACVLTSPSQAARHRRVVCVPVYIEGAGTVRICPPARGR